MKIDIIKHPKERDGKSTAIHAAILARDDVKIYTYPDIPEYDDDPNSGTVSVTNTQFRLNIWLTNNQHLFTSQNRYWFSPATIRNMWTESSMRIYGWNRPTKCRQVITSALCWKSNEKKSRRMTPIQHVCGITPRTICQFKEPFSLTARGTSAVAFTEIRESINCGMSYCRIVWRNSGDTKKVVHDGFWQPLKVRLSIVRWRILFEIEHIFPFAAIHQFLLEVHINAWGLNRTYCRSLDSLEIQTNFINEHLIIDKKDAEHVDGCTDPYNGQYDNLFFFYTHIYQLIHEYYDRTDSKTARRPIK